MKTNKLLKLTIAAVIALMGVYGGNAFAITLWEYGNQDQSYVEFFDAGKNGMYAPYISTYFGEVSPENPAKMDTGFTPGYLYNANPSIEFEHVTLLAVNELKFEFQLVRDYLELDLYYGRFGSEIDEIYFDGVLIGTVDGTREGEYDLFDDIAITADLLGVTVIAADTLHTLSIQYAGGDAANGHFIDFLRLENGVSVPEPTNDTAPVPEPATILLLGSGCLGLAFFCKKSS